MSFEFGAFFVFEGGFVYVFILTLLVHFAIEATRSRVALSDIY